MWCSNKPATASCSETFRSYFPKELHAEECFVLRYQGTQSAANPSTIQTNTLLPSSGSKSMLGKQVTSRINVYSANSLAPKMDAVHSSTTLVNFYKTTRHHIPEGSNLHSCQCENFTHHSSMSFSHLHQHLPSCVLISGFSTELLHPYLTSPACPTRSAYLINISITMRMNSIYYIRGPQTFRLRDHLLHGLSLANTHILNKIFLNGMRVKFSQKSHAHAF
jgi:hypothetical protein